MQSKVPLPPTHTARYFGLDASDLDTGSTVVYGEFGSEPRGRLSTWAALRSTEASRCVVVTSETKEQICIAGRNEAVQLRDHQGLQSLLPSRGTIYLDISGLSHHAWAPLLRAALATGAQTKVVYVEPEGYKPHPSPASPNMFDLSDEVEGVAPLPGFARLAGPPDDNKVLFVPFLGFEGSRPFHLAMQLDPPPKVIPIVGVPGFRLEYPAFTLACNRMLLHEFQAYSEVRLARASCPFEAYAQLKELRVDYPNHYLYLAPVGTKPHSLAAVKYALDNPDSCEILYDHPTRKKGRTTGVGLIHIYNTYELS